MKCKIAMAEPMPCGKTICCYTCEEHDTCQYDGYACKDFENLDEVKKTCPDLINDGEESSLQVMNKAVPQVIEEITKITVQMKELKEQEKIMKEKLVKAMEEFGVKSFENDEVKFLYVVPTTRTSLDSTKLKKDHPDIAEAYQKTSNVSASVRISVK